MTGTGIKHLKHGEDDWNSTSNSNINQLRFTVDVGGEKAISNNVFEQPLSLQSINMLSPSLWTRWHADASRTGYSFKMMEAAPVWTADCPQTFAPVRSPLRQGGFHVSATVGLQCSFTTATALTPMQQLQVFCSPLRYPLPSCSRYYRISLCNPHIAGRNSELAPRGTCCSLQSEVNPRG